MGLAASQARLLTITARLADNELRSQTINNAKMRLATQSAQASNEYVSALNNAQLMFNNTAENGIAQSQALTFNSLTQYSQYNNQYGLINSAGQILVSEADEKMFKDNSNNLEGFLKAHGLEWDTTYFDMKDTDGTQIDLAKRLTDFYSTGSDSFIGNLFSGMNNEQLKEMYLNSISQEASIEYLNYDVLARNYYKAISELAEILYTDLRNEIFGGSTSAMTEEAVIEAVKKLGSANEVRNEFLSGNAPIDDSIDNGAKFALDNISKYLTPEAYATLFNQLSLLADYNGNTGMGSDQGDISTLDLKLTYPYYDKATDTVYDKEYDYGKQYTFGANPSFKINTGIPTFIEKTDTRSDGTTIKYKVIDSSVPTYSTIQSSDKNYTYNGQDISSPYKLDPNFTFDPSNVASVMNVLDKIKATTDNGTVIYKYEDIIEGTAKNTDGSFNDTTTKHVIKITPSSDPSSLYETFAKEYFSSLFSNISAFDLNSYVQNSDSNRLEALTPEGFSEYGISLSIPNEGYLLLDLDKMVEQKKLTYNNVNSKMKSVMGVYMTEKMVYAIGEPKYAWVDKSANPTDNPDNKAQWLTNLFNRMQKGYKVLENGLASSSQWLEHAFESGLVTMEQVDMSYNWINMDYKSCANIYEQTDNSAIVAKAEAKYNRAMNDIKQKDSLFDLQLKNIDTEHSSLQTEYDVIKGVISKNIERTMKFDQSA